VAALPVVALTETEWRVGAAESGAVPGKSAPVVNVKLSEDALPGVATAVQFGSPSTL
jgi:hypothetical protein